MPLGPGVRSGLDQSRFVRRVLRARIVAIENLLLQVLSTLSTLETLDLEDNLLGGGEQGDGAFPPGIAGLSRLQWLNIARCELQQVPHLVERLSALRILDLTNNR